jgi:2-amino-4-hydroxy-6-hydroxymethyldihydropteridine diphosphokinase
MVNKAYLLLGSNLGDRQQNLSVALQRLSQEAGTIVQTSSVYETSAWGVTNQPDFRNQVLLLETVLEPMQLLRRINQIELEMGRNRQVRWESRIIDIDILYYNDLVLLSDDLVIPHPSMTERRFTLVPLVQIAPEFIHPVLQISNRELLENCPDHLPVVPVAADALAGSP